MGYSGSQQVGEYPYVINIRTLYVGFQLAVWA